MTTYKASQNIPVEVARRMLTTPNVLLTNRMRKNYKAALEKRAVSSVPLIKGPKGYEQADIEPKNLAARNEGRVRKSSLRQLGNMVKRLPMKRRRLLRLAGKTGKPEVAQALKNAQKALGHLETCAHSEVDFRTGDNVSFNKCNRRQVARAIRNGTAIPSQF